MLKQKMSASVKKITDTLNRNLNNNPGQKFLAKIFTHTVNYFYNIILYQFMSNCLKAKKN